MVLSRVGGFDGQKGTNDDTECSAQVEASEEWTDDWMTDTSGTATPKSVEVFPQRGMDRSLIHFCQLDARPGRL